MCTLPVILWLSTYILVHVVGKPGFKVPIQRVPRVRHLGSVLSLGIPITSRNEFAYVAPVSVGGQDFSVTVDTGSSDLWIVSSNCTTLDCQMVPKYSIAQSHSLLLSGEPFRVSYLLGSATGDIAFETVNIGDFEISSQVFALVNRTLGLGLSGTGNSGILGLSFPSIAAISNGDTFLENIFSNFDEPNRFFAYKLGRVSGLSDLTSSFTFGELDPDITSDFDDFSFTSVSRAGGGTFDYWKLHLLSLIVDSTEFLLSPSLIPGVKTPVAVLDTGTTLILGPTPDVDALWQSVSRQGSTRKNNETGMWEVRCDHVASVSFVLGEIGSPRAYPVDPSDINWKEAESTMEWCMGGIQASDAVNSGDWLLGDAFLRNVYVMHHYGNSTHQPFIGLLSTTDPSVALSRFLEARGPDVSASIIH